MLGSSLGDLLILFLKSPWFFSLRQVGLDLWFYIGHSWSPRLRSGILIGPYHRWVRGALSSNCISLAQSAIVSWSEIVRTLTDQNLGLKTSQPAFVLPIIAAPHPHRVLRMEPTAICLFCSLRFGEGHRLPLALQVFPCPCFGGRANECIYIWAPSKS